jgi:hypothetical protein
MVILDGGRVATLRRGMQPALSADIFAISAETSYRQWNQAMVIRLIVVCVTSYSSLV